MNICQDKPSVPHAPGVPAGATGTRRKALRAGALLVAGSTVVKAAVAPPHAQRFVVVGGGFGGLCRTYELWSGDTMSRCSNASPTTRRPDAT